MEALLECGFDEAGRGPLAGPVVAASCILPSSFPVECLNDSKKLSLKKRIFCDSLIRQTALFSVAVVDHKTIDQINILNASLLAMKIAYHQMIEKLPEWAQKQGISSWKISCIADGNQIPDVTADFLKAEPKADGKYPCVMAASILAKVYRDNIMEKMDALYPEYGYKKHKGYPTKEHMQICRTIGPSPIQRLSFNYNKT